MNDKRILIYFIVFRLSSVYLVQTFFVPDEYWQSLEVAHHMVYGYGYLTWEWRTGIRNYLYPSIFAILYHFLYTFHLDYTLVLVYLPRCFQALCTAVGDLYTVKMARRLYGETAALWTFLCLFISWFLFYCGSRTLSNTMETALTSVALYYYPFERQRRVKTISRAEQRTGLFMTLAALVVLLRPTSLVLWAPLCAWHLFLEKFSLNVLKSYIVVGFCTFVFMVCIDRFFYGRWISTLFNFINFNVLSDQGAFYGTHSWHWYFSQGFPVIMASHLLPFILERYRCWKSPIFGLILWQLLIYSCISHKEFRFILPVLPLAICEVGKYLASIGKKAALVYALLFFTNVPLMVYFGLIHQRGPLDSINFLAGRIASSPNSSVLFLMPCHSTPLYSHIHHNVQIRFLTCEPNLNGINNYVDEADQFYLNPATFLSKEYNNMNIDNLPSFVVIFDVLEAAINDFIKGNVTKLSLCAKYFHTHFNEGRIGNYINIYCRL